MPKNRKLAVLFLSLASAILLAAGLWGQEAKPAPGGLPVRYEELTAPDFVRALEKSGGTCLIPLGVIEKHGPHLPLGTDLLNVRLVALRAAQQEYTIVFPEYFFSQIFEARHQPGTLAYSQKLMWAILEETCDELGRNGVKKIILVSGHGGNSNFLPYFCQAQLARRRDYAVYLYRPTGDPKAEEQIRKMRKTTTGGHADEEETAVMLANRPELVHLDRAKNQSGADQKRLTELPDFYAGIWWYASFPNHYAGDGSPATRELGELLVENEVKQLVKAIQEVKKDKAVLELQKRFFDEAENPLKTQQ
jgi:creatinine amidohydrolase